MAEAPVRPPAFRVFIGNLNYSTSWEALKDICAKEVGAVNYVNMPLRNGRPSGHAIVEFPSMELAQRAIETLNDVEIDSRRIFVRMDVAPAMRPPREGTRPARYGAGAAGAGAAGAAGGAPGKFQRPPRAEGTFPKKVSGEDHTTIYISGLSFSAEWQDLKDLCRPYGTVEYADVFRNHLRRSRGMGVVRFAERESVAAAIEALNGTEFLNRIISVRKFEPNRPAPAAAATEGAEAESTEAAPAAEAEAAPAVASE